MGIQSIYVLMIDTLVQRHKWLGLFKCLLDSFYLICKHTLRVLYIFLSQPGLAKIKVLCHIVVSL